MLTHYRLSHLISDSKSHDFIIYGSGKQADRLCRILKLLDISPLCGIDTEIPPGHRTAGGLEIKSIYQLLYEDLDKIIVLVFGKNEQVIHTLTGMGLDRNRNIKDVYEYREPLFLDKEYGLDVMTGYIRQETCCGIQGFCCYGNDKAEQTIVTLGGSTTDDGAWDCKSWSQLLWEKLAEAGYSVRVVCGGVSGFSIYQELQLLIRDVLPQKPFLVLDYSGVNQLGSAVLPGHPYINHYQKMLFDSLKLKKQGSFHLGSFCGSVNLGAGAGNQSPYESYRQVLRLMNAICREQGIGFVSYFQPMLYYKCGKLCRQEREMMLNQSLLPMERNPFTQECLQFQDEMKKGLRSCPFQTDLSGLFDGKEQIYFDYCHVGERGNEIIADAILADLEKRKII